MAGAAIFMVGTVGVGAFRSIGASVLVLAGELDSVQSVLVAWVSLSWLFGLAEAHERADLID